MKSFVARASRWGGEPTLLVAARQSEMLTKWIDEAEYRRRLSHFRNHTEAAIDDAGHMLHHDQPQALARLIEDFIAPLPGQGAARP